MRSVRNKENTIFYLDTLDTTFRQIQYDEISRMLGCDGGGGEGWHPKEALTEYPNTPHQDN